MASGQDPRQRGESEAECWEGAVRMWEEPPGLSPACSILRNRATSLGSEPWCLGPGKDRGPEIHLIKSGRLRILGRKGKGKGMAFSVCVTAVGCQRGV